MLILVQDLFRCIFVYTLNYIINNCHHFTYKTTNKIKSYPFNLSWSFFMYIFCINKGKGIKNHNFFFTENEKLK